MSQKVKGYLARDGQFFESEPECARYRPSKTYAVCVSQTT